MTYSSIQREYGYTYPFIARWSKRYRETGSVDDLPRSGRPRKLNPQARALLTRSLKHRQTASLRKTAKYMERVHNIHLSPNTVRAEAQRLGLVYRRRQKKPLLNNRQKVARLRFARKRRPRGFWRQVFWTDEASFALYSDTKGAWVEKGSDAPVRETVKWPPRIRVWGGISTRGKTPLIEIPKSMNAKEFEKLMVDTFLLAMDTAYGGEPRSYVLMQDGDGCHTAKTVQNCLENEGVEQLLPWPAHSPDLNPIENAWSMVERHLETVYPTTRDGLWRAMQDAWEKIDERQLLQLCQSLPRRLEAVKRADGGHTKY